MLMQRADVVAAFNGVVGMASDAGYFTPEARALALRLAQALGVAVDIPPASSGFVIVNDTPELRSGGRGRLGDGGGRVVSHRVDI